MGGTLPIDYRGATYNIPVKLYVVAQYPRQPPIAYVSPTADMAIRPNHQHVGSDGMCYMPLLHSWQSSPYAHNNNLTNVAMELQRIFATAPPVFAKSQLQSQQQQQQQQRPPPPPVHRPPPPPITQPPPQTSRLPNVPPPPITRPQTTQQPPEWQRPPPNNNRTPPAPAAQQWQSPPDPLAAAAERKRMQIDDIATRLQRLVEAYKQQMDRELQPLRSNRDQLQRDHQLMQQKQQEVQQHSLQLNGGIKQLLEADDALTQFLSENQPDGDPRSKIFDTMHFEQPYSMQLVDTVATDHTITDCVAELDMLLGDRGMELEEYLFNVRKLAKDQFMARAMISKIKKKQQRCQSIN